MHFFKSPPMRHAIFLLIIFLVCIAPNSAAQKANKKITISGTILDQNNKPVQGGVIFIDKAKTSSVSDQNGRYSVKVRSDAAEILVFTLLYGSAEELIGGRTTIDFMLGTNSQEVPQSRNEQSKLPGQKKMLDGTADEFSSHQNIYDMIRGRFPGVDVSGKTIRVSGSSSLNVSTDPLFVVDGIVVNTLDDISPRTVKSIEVLKGPAASVWGTRGANGVIVITRRSGKE
jgi:TonB-dependent SusC/RagA subfamily outer membrane receptor